MGVYHSQNDFSNQNNLDYSRAEIAVAVRCDGCRCGTSLQILHNNEDVVRSPCPYGVNLAEFVLVTFMKNGRKLG